MLPHEPLIFIVAWLLSAAAAVLTALRKKSPMTDQPVAAAAAAISALPPVAAAAPAAPEAANDMPMVSAGNDVRVDNAIAVVERPPVDSNAVVTSIVQTVQNHPDVPASAAPNVIASILSGLYQAEPAIFAVSRASAKTQTEFGLGFGLLQLVLGAFLHTGG